MALSTIFLSIFLALFCVHMFTKENFIEFLCGIAAVVTAVLLLINK